LDRISRTRRDGYFAAEASAAGALALLVFLHAIWLQAGAVSLKRFVLYGIAAFAAGVGIAMLGYVVRYWSKGAGLFHQIASLWIPVLAIACFVAGLALPVYGALDSLPPERPGEAVPKKR
jgi:hypothetical protein